MSELPLTKKKQKWANNRATTLRGKKLLYNIAAQQRYKMAIEKLVLQMTDEVKKEILKLFRSNVSKDFFKEQIKSVAMDDSLSSQARILMNALTKKFYKLFNLKSKSLADMMLNTTLSTSKTSLHSSLKQLSGGLSLKTGVVPKGMEDVSKAIIEENVSLIKSIPQQYLKDVTGSVMRSITTGRGVKDLLPNIEKFEGQTNRRAKNIALDQTRKAYNSINKQRMVNLGVKQFEWIHSGGGQTPRDSHLKIDGKIFSFEHLREEQEKLGVPKKDQGIPGEPINCRCTILPIIDLSDNEE